MPLLAEMAATDIAAAGAACLIAAVSTGLAMWYRRAHDAASEELRRQSDVVDHLHEGIYRSSLDGRMLRSNPALVRLNGYSSQAELLAGVRDIATEWYVEPTRRKEFQDILARDGEVEDFVSEIYRHKTRERIWISESARLVRDRRGKALYYEGSVREITETMRRLQLEERFRKLTSRIPVGLFQFEVDSHERISALYLNERWGQITGLSGLGEMEDRLVFRDRVHPDDLAEFLHRRLESQEQLSTWNCEFRFLMPDGSEKWLEVNAEPEAGPGVIVYHGYLADISDRKKQEMEVAELAFFDTLTRLPNRRHFLRQMSAAIALRAERGDFGALLFVDIDNFKSLNDTQGHDVGDAFLVETANRLRQTMRSEDTIARIGGDEFVAILNGAGLDAKSAGELASDVAQRMLASLREGFKIGSLRHMGSASIGIVIFDGADVPAEEILKRADIAMYRAKLSGRNAVALFNPDDIELQAGRYHLASEFAEALAADQLELYLQPQVDAGGRIWGAEALLRWNHPSRGLISPDEFLGIAEQFGLAADMERAVLAKGIAILQTWAADARTARLRLALNVGVQSFANDGFVPLVRGLIAKHAVDPARITFEVTEHVMAKDQRRIAERMRALKQLGVRLSLDDFGTGYSSLGYLKQLPFDEIKIDGSFVSDIETDGNDRAIVRAIIAMAQSLGMETAAEHVENAEQEAFLRSLGCDLYQGFLYSPAVRVGKFSELLGAGQAATEADHHRRWSAAPRRSRA